MAVNDTVDAVGFDFIRTPEPRNSTGQVKDLGFIKIETFRNDAVVREPAKKRGNLETLSMVLLDYDYDEDGKIFDQDAVLYADVIQKEGWKICFPLKSLGRKMMAVFLDIYGNEARELIDAAAFGPAKALTRKKER
jgi:hypothetical protein